MEVVTRTPYHLVPQPGRLQHPGHSLTLIAKATFDLVPGAAAEPSDVQLFPTGNEFYPDDDEGTGSSRYESDFAHFKPRADLLLAGTCHAPGARAVESCPVSFQVGSRRRELLVTGDRRWSGPMGMGGLTEPKPFSELELRYERSFGGDGYQQNPVGRGYGGAKESGEHVRMVPNIEDPHQPISFLNRRPAPIGFGPLGATWKQRFAKVGTYNKNWLNNRWPWFPEDFDFGYNNAADEAMQVADYLRGDEDLCFENLHADHPTYESRLPGIRIRCFLNERIAEGDDAEAFQFREVPMKLDTLWVDMDAENLVLVWRGTSNIRDEEFVEMEQAFMIAESLGDEMASLEACRKAFIADRAEFAKEVEIEVEAPPEAPELPGASDVEPPEVVAAAAGTMKEQITAQIAAYLGVAGLDLDSVSDEVRAEVNKKIDAAIEADPIAREAADQQLLEEQLEKALREVGLDADAPPAMSAKAKLEQVRMLQELGVEDAEAVLLDPETASLFAMLGAGMAAAGVDTENLSDVIDAAKAQPGMQPDPDEEDSATKPIAAEERPRPLTREIIEAEVERGESFIDEDFKGLDLSGLSLAGVNCSGSNFSEAQMNGTDFTGAILRGCPFDAATLDEAIFVEANLSGASLSSASMRGATLDSADLTKATLRDAVLDGASLGATLFYQAQLQGASLLEVSAGEAIFIEANLEGANLSKSDFSKADFSQGVLNGANFREATLAEASIEDAECQRADFRGADLTKLRASDGSDFTECRFNQAKASESIWAEANLSDCDFSHADLERASFAKANLTRAILFAANMKNARMIRANLTNTNARMVNLFEATLEKANLSFADFTGSNLYGAELVDVVLDDTELAETNLRMTKLA